MLDEIWKDIKGFEGLYQISSKGRILGLERFREDGRRTCKERMLKMSKNKDKGLVIPTLIDSDGDLHRTPLFKLIVDNFEIEDPETLVIYKDGNFGNCSVDNITFLSKTDNGFDDEVWEAIPGYEGVYEISNYCRVWRLPTKTRHGHIHRGDHIKPEIHNETGGYRVHLNKNKGKGRILVWKLMCLTFLKEVPGGVLYKDDNPINCKIENLILTETKTHKTYHADRSVLVKNIPKTIVRSDSSSFVLQSLFKVGFGYYAPSNKSACDLLGLSQTAIRSKLRRKKANSTIIKGFKTTKFKREDLCLA